MENKKKYRKKWVNSNKEKVKFLYKNYYKIYSSLSKNKLKIIARNIIKRDKIKRPNLYPLECCICGVTDNIEFHHPLYKQNKEVQNEIMDYLSGLSLKWYIVISKECDACNNKCYRLHKIDTKEQGFIRVCQTCF